MKTISCFLFLSALLENDLFFLYFYLVFSSCTGCIDTKVVFFLELLFLALSNWKETQWENDKELVKINIAGL